MSLAIDYIYINITIKIIDLNEVKTRNNTSLYCYGKRSQNIDDVIISELPISTFKRDEKGKRRFKMVMSRLKKI